MGGVNKKLWVVLIRNYQTVPKYEKSPFSHSFMKVTLSSGSPSNHVFSFVVVVVKAAFDSDV